MDQVDDVVVDDRQRLAGGTGLAQRRLGTTPSGWVVPVADGEGGVAQAADALRQALANEGLDVDDAVLQQFERDGDDLRAGLEDVQRGGAEGRIGRGGGGVLRDPFAGFRRAVGGR